MMKSRDVCRVGNPYDMEMACVEINRELNWYCRDVELKWVQHPGDPVANPDNNIGHFEVWFGEND